MPLLLAGVNAGRLVVLRLLPAAAATAAMRDDGCRPDQAT